MAIKFSTAVRNGMLDSFETTIGASPVLELRSGAAPAAISDADSGTLIASMTLPSDWMNAAASGSKSKAGTWTDLAANNAGVIGHFRLKDSGGTVHAQGTVSQSGDSPAGELVVNNTTVAAGQTVSISTFTLTAGNA